MPRRPFQARKLSTKTYNGEEKKRHIGLILYSKTENT